MRRSIFAFGVTLLVAVFLASPIRAEVLSPYPGTQIIETKTPYGSYVKKLLAAVQANKMGVVGHACATCGAKNIGVTIPGNRVIMIFNPHFAVRMLKASVPAGVEAPLRLYVTENADGTAKLTYRLPSTVFKPYGSNDLDAMAKELDVIFAKIVDMAAQ